MIIKLFNRPHIFYQTADNEDDLPEYPIAIHTDNMGMICLEQEGRSIILNNKSLVEFSNFIKKYNTKK